MIEDREEIERIARSVSRLDHARRPVASRAWVCPVCQTIIPPHKGHGHFHR